MYALADVYRPIVGSHFSTTMESISGQSPDYGLMGGRGVVPGSKAREIINYSFLSALADDGVIDESELSYIKSLALADGVVDADEISALKRIFALVDESGLSEVSRTEFQKFRRKYEL